MKMASALMIIWLVLSLSPAGFSGWALAQDTKSGPQTIKGQLVMLAGEVAILRDSNGKTTHVPTSKATRVEKGIKDGDMVEASISPDGQATSITRSK
jgi:hypothetical protein